MVFWLFPGYGKAGGVPLVLARITTFLVRTVPSVRRPLTLTVTFSVANSDSLTVWLNWAPSAMDLLTAKLTRGGGVASR